jgi:FkbM family methyltransferase
MKKLGPRIRYVRHLLDKVLLLRRGFPLSELGDKSNLCAWTLCPQGLDAQSVVYSAGVGKDITFEHALVERFGCQVTLLDPSPTGLETMNRPENKIPQFKFLPIGLAGRSGTIRLAPPPRAEEGSWFASGDGEGTIEVPCRDLASLLEEHRHPHVDLLKMDIEGAEYGVIDQILQARLPVRQILVEFHDGILSTVGHRHTVRAVVKLVARGYKLISEVGNDHTFIR